MKYIANIFYQSFPYHSISHELHIFNVFKYINLLNVAICFKRSGCYPSGAIPELEAPFCQLPLWVPPGQRPWGLLVSGLPSLTVFRHMWMHSADRLYKPTFLPLSKFSLVSHLSSRLKCMHISACSMLRQRTDTLQPLPQLPSMAPVGHTNAHPSLQLHDLSSSILLVYWKPPTQKGNKIIWGFHWKCW